MKTTIDIPENELRDAMRFTRATTKREAVVKAWKNSIVGGGWPNW